MSASKVLLLFGHGNNIGPSVAKLFSQNGYKVAIVARRLKDSVNEDGQLQIQADLSHPESVDSAFDKVIDKFGVPNVVVYNAATAHFVSKENPLELSVADLNEDSAVNISSALVAARRAVEGFQKLSSETPKTYIYTGNFLNKEVLPALISNGIGKSGAAHIVHVASQVYAPKGYHFYYADERTADGNAAFRDVSGPNHANHYLDLAETNEQKPWLQTFVGGQGYKSFP